MAFQWVHAFPPNLWSIKLISCLFHSFHFIVETIEVSFIPYIGLIITSLSSTVFVITCWLWDSSLVDLLPPPGFLSILGPGFCCACGTGTCGSSCGCRGACRLELRPEAHSQSLLSSSDSESAWLSWITGSPFTSTMVLRTLSYVVRGLRFRRFAGPQSGVGWHRSRTLWKVNFTHIAILKGFSSGVLNFS
jgi:hypothetical protein